MYNAPCLRRMLPALWAWWALTVYTDEVLKFLWYASNRLILHDQTPLMPFRLSYRASEWLQVEWFTKRSTSYPTLCHRGVGCGETGGWALLALSKDRWACLKVRSFRRVSESKLSGLGFLVHISRSEIFPAGLWSHHYWLNSCAFNCLWHSATVTIY